MSEGQGMQQKVKGRGGVGQEKSLSVSWKVVSIRPRELYKSSFVSHN